MVNFDNDFVKKMQEKMERFSKYDKKGDVFSKVSVIVTKGDNQVSVARRENLDFSWATDESGPGPLAYFVSSLAMCQMGHYAEHAGSSNMKISDLQIRVEGKFKISRPRFFTDITFHVDIASSEEEREIVKLARNAAFDCYITNTLAKACKVEGLLNLNGKEIGAIDF